MVMALQALGSEGAPCKLFCLCLLLTPIVLVLHGYHPRADDGGIYVAGVQRLVDPTLFAADSIFALTPTQVSLFAHVLAAFVRWGHIPLALLLLACQLASIFLFLLASWKVAARLYATDACTDDPESPGAPSFASFGKGWKTHSAHRTFSYPTLRKERERWGTRRFRVSLPVQNQCRPWKSQEVARWGAVLLAACCFTLPVAGTSLCIMDPYVTARSFSTPLGLFALASVLDKKWARCALWLGLAALLHPLMAIYAALAMVALALSENRMWRSLTILFGSGWMLAAAVFLFSRHGSLTTPPDLAVLSRSYFFLSSWRWYEYFGLILPLVLLGMSRRGVAIAAVVLCSCALLISVCFVHRSGSLFLARLQVLRTFQFLYIVGVLLAGGWLGTLALKHPRSVAAAYLSIALALFAGQRLTYPASQHLEWPGRPPSNAWQKAFSWIRENTPRNAVFALDNDYIESAGEDAQSFRATAERSAVADYFKDGGIASNFPQAATAWLRGSQATNRLNAASDEQRWARLKPLGVSWIVLPAAVRTESVCPYTNAVVRVCRLSPLLHEREGAK